MTTPSARDPIEPTPDQAASDKATPPARRRVLVVDDNVDSARTLGMMLELLGNEVHFAHDGLEAVDATAKLAPDAVIMDLGLPRLNGCDAARRMREQPDGQRLFLIALTGWGEDEDKRRTMEAGFDVHLVKPVSPTALGDLLEEKLRGPVDKRQP